MLGAAKSSSWTAGGAREFLNTILMVVATASGYGAARHLTAHRFTAKTRMIAWRKQRVCVRKRIKHSRWAMLKLCPDSLTISTFQTGESAFRQGRQAKTLEMKLSVAVTLTHHQTLSIRLADLHTNKQMVMTQ